jgi:phospholipid transport system substrate-binding protein
LPAIARRHFLAVSVAAATAPLVAATAASASVASDTSFLKTLGDELVAVVNGPGSDAQKTAKLQALVDRSVDVNGIARFCLGRFVRLATPQQLATYLQLFHGVLMRSITGHLGEYKGVAFTVDKSAAREGGTVVTTTVTRPNNAPAKVEWVVNDVNGKPKVVDVIAEGTSMRLTQQSDYASFIARNNNNIGALIAAMEKQAQNQ